MNLICFNTIMKPQKIKVFYWSGSHCGCTSSAVLILVLLLATAPCFGLVFNLPGYDTQSEIAGGAGDAGDND